MADFTHFPTEREQVLTAGDTQIGVIPEVALVSHFQVGPWPVLYRPAETGNISRCGLPLMIPNFASLKDGIFQEKGTTLPMHGFGRRLPWTVIAQEQSSIAIQLMSNDSTRPHYPYEFTFTALIAAGEGSLTYTLTMENRSNEVMPIAPGFHPYFNIAQQDKARISTDGPTGFAVNAFQWDTQPPDNSYAFPHHVTLEMPQHGTLTIAELPDEGQYKLAKMQIWTEPASAPDHNFVCFEPVVASADGLNRPADRLNIAPHGKQRIILRLNARAGTA